MSEDEQETVAAFVRKQWDGRADDQYLSLGELCELQYNGHEIKISDVASKLKKGKRQKLSLLKIIKKRAAYQQYLNNRERKKKEEEEGPPLPNIRFPDILLPSLPDSL